MKSDTGFRLVPKSVILSHGRINGDHSSNASLYEVRGNCNMDKFTDREYAYTWNSFCIAYSADHQRKHPNRKLW